MCHLLELVVIGINREEVFVGRYHIAALCLGQHRFQGVEPPGVPFKRVQLSIGARSGEMVRICLRGSGNPTNLALVSHQRRKVRGLIAWCRGSVDHNGLVRSWWGEDGRREAGGLISKDKFSGLISGLICVVREPDWGRLQGQPGHAVDRVMCVAPIEDRQSGQFGRTLARRSLRV